MCCCRLPRSIVWLGGREAFPDWVVGAANRFYYGNYPTS